MTSVSSWVLSIVGVCFISVIADMILLDGKTNLHIKRIISYAIILVIVLPLPKLFNSDISVDTIFSTTELEIQDNYIYSINQSKLDAYAKNIEQELENNGYKGITISISADIFDTNMQIFAIYVDLYNLVITDELKNINIKTEVVEIVTKIIDIASEKVIIYE